MRGGDTEQRINMLATTVLKADCCACEDKFVYEHYNLCHICYLIVSSLTSILCTV